MITIGIYYTIQPREWYSVCSWLLSVILLRNKGLQLHLSWTSISTTCNDIKCGVSLLINCHFRRKYKRLLFIITVNCWSHVWPMRGKNMMFWSLTWRPWCHNADTRELTSNSHDAMHDDPAVDCITASMIARFMGPRWAHLGPTGPRWAPYWPHELCYLGPVALSGNGSDGGHVVKF